MHLFCIFQTSNKLESKERRAESALRMQCLGSLCLTEACSGRTLKSGWARVCKMFEEEAKQHQIIAETIRTRVCEPLTTFKEAQKKEHKTHQVYPLPPAHTSVVTVSRREVEFGIQIELAPQHTHTPNARF